MPGNRAKRETEAGERQVPVETELKNEFSGKKKTYLESTSNELGQG